MQVSTETFDREVVERSHALPVVVDFWAGWCVPCRMLGPVLDREVAARGGKLLLAKVDVDANPKLAVRYGVAGIPAVMAFRNGHVVDEFVGALPPQQIARFLDRLTEPLAAQLLLEELRIGGKLPDVVEAIDAGQLEQALELLVERLFGSDAFERERIRRLAVVLLTDLGANHPLSARYRHRLATAVD